MSTVRVVTDSACELEPELAAEAGITVIPLSVSFGSETLDDGVDIDAEGFYRRMAESVELPTTAAPAAGRFEQVFRGLAADGATQIFCVNLSYELSATGQAARVAAEAVADVVEVRCADSAAVSAALGTIVLEVAAAAGDGASLDDLEALRADLAARTRCFGALDTMENLRKGGRVGGAKALAATVLSIKPIVDLSSGRVEEAARTRTRRRSFQWLRDRIVADEPVSKICTAHAAAEDFEVFLEAMGEVVDLSRIRQAKVGPIVGTHGGRGVVALSYLVGSSA